jgi:quercetin dioxygenase-like cupin family protein
VNRWSLTALDPSSEKRRPREPGRDAARIERTERQAPRVLFTTPECRAIVVDLERGETMGDHAVRERLVLSVVSGSVVIESPGDGEAAECDAGTLATFEPGERHAVRALSSVRLLLLLAPWPAADHYTAAEEGRAQQLPPNAAARPMPKQSS